MPREFNFNQYQLHLTQARSERGVDLSSISFDPQKHPRDAKGRFRETVGDLIGGSRIALPDGTSVGRSGRTFHAYRGGRVIGSSDNPSAVADAAFESSDARGTGPVVRPRGRLASLDDAFGSPRTLSRVEYEMVLHAIDAHLTDDDDDEDVQMQDLRDAVRRGALGTNHYATLREVIDTEIEIGETESPADEDYTEQLISARKKLFDRPARGS